MQNMNVSGAISPIQNSQQTQNDVIKDQAFINGQKALESMTTGETLKGEVLMVSSSDEVYVSIGENAVIKANIEGKVFVSPGESIYLEVSRMSGDTIGLRALFTNTAQEQVAFNALESAGISVNNNSLQLVSSLLQEGMSVDKSNLLSMYRMILSNPDAQINHLVQMNKIGIECSESNIRQFDAMCNYEQNIRQSFTDILELIPEYLSDLSEDSLDAAKDISLKLMQVLNPDPGLDDTMLQTDKENLMLNQEPLQDNTAILQGNDNNSVPGKEHTSSSFFDLSITDRKELYHLLKEQGFSETILEGLKQGFMNKSEFMEQFKALLFSEKPELSKLLGNHNFQKLFTGLLSDLSLINPKDLDKDSISRFYHKITSQALGFADGLGEALSGSARISKALSNFSEQLDFMNSFNKFIPYVQLPVKFANEGSTGDLYVLSNKKKFTDPDEQITALLHLNMKYLGNLDVYVMMKNQNVTTNFTVENEEVLDFIAEHIDELNERLESRGYHTNSNISLKEKKNDLSSELSRSVSTSLNPLFKEGEPIEYLRFDMRA
ncbi:MAG: flagellar hook-length control protein FliK [Lachnospiraceae bacterium]|nr:flagellar hook-length control protein FliK [Lachnospiraceae bacterium]